MAFCQFEEFMPINSFSKLTVKCLVYLLKIQRKSRIGFETFSYKNIQLFLSIWIDSHSKLLKFGGSAEFIKFNERVNPNLERELNIFKLGDRVEFILSLSLNFKQFDYFSKFTIKCLIGTAIFD